jgi:hypothetical protein
MRNQLMDRDKQWIMNGWHAICLRSGSYTATTRLKSRNKTKAFMNRRLEDKVAAVTGGSASIGLGAANRFVGEGARVFITGRRQSELDKAVATIEGKVIAIKGDASNLADIGRIYQTVKTEAGRIDVLFVNAGFYEFGRRRQCCPILS